jgi:serine/threonine-protein phosphatase 4 catalytic subunit
LGALIEGKIFCVHGGISPDSNNIDKLELEDRVKEIPH